MCYVTSDDESGLNLLIPEDYLHAHSKNAKTEKQQKKNFADEDDDDSEEDYSEKKDATDLYESNYGKEVRFSLWKYCKNDFAIRKMPRFDIKTDKKQQKETTFKVTTNSYTLFYQQILINKDKNDNLFICFFSRPTQLSVWKKENTSKWKNI